MIFIQINNGYDLKTFYLVMDTIFVTKHAIVLYNNKFLMYNKYVPTGKKKKQ